MTDHLFVYGTLAPGRPNEHVLASVRGTWEPATVRGRLLQHGWGAAVGFPGIVLDDDGPEVEGMLLSSEDLSHSWERLDQFEGDGYARVQASVRRRNGGTAVAHIYVLNGQSEVSAPDPSAS
ncbi:MAG TPA: gamma-glutamylcyclotransferase family protein [Flexivirga sp.]|uniref:gamma-glutamylcyclotransferase family protein n=1 Tax=Flexivirga sp. TaxID=1962927 RepID=UPI002C5F9A57|nr:gamma-glutamylcyclotransferase family protein [Flexivirga sp.]HWC24655.1 gamma-glutamylcyclotransferase family protein [Flexivirga sp.]